MPTQWNPADYARNSRGQFGWAWSVLERLGLRGDEHVLDVGCGDGKVTVEIAKRTTGDVIGIDQSADMIELARRTWAVAHRNLSFLVADAQKLDVACRVDVVFSNAALHWMPDQAAVLVGLARVLEPGGRVFLSMGGRGTAPLVFKALADLSRDARWSGLVHDPPYYFRGPEEFDPWLRQAGFEPTRVELVPKPMWHADQTALTGWLRTTWMWLTDRLPEERRSEFLDELTSLIAPGCPPSDAGGLLLPMVNLEVEARYK